MSDSAFLTTPQLNHSQAVKIGNRLEFADQGAWNLTVALTRLALLEQLDVENPHFFGYSMGRDRAWTVRALRPRAHVSRRVFCLRTHRLDQPSATKRLAAHEAC